MCKCNTSVNSLNMLHAKRNKVNGLYFAGQPTDLHTRSKVLDMYNQGKTFAEISSCTGITSCVGQPGFFRFRDSSKLLVVSVDNY